MKQGDLLISLGLGLVMVPLALYTQGPVRVTLGIPFVLFLPGYTLIAALFPRRADLSGPERLAYSMGLSLALVPIVGIVLNFTPWGIRLLPMVLSLALLIVALAGFALYRRESLAPNEDWTAPVRLPTGQAGSAPSAAVQRWREQGWLARLLMVTLAIASVGFVVTSATVIAVPRVTETFTEFYLLEPTGRADSYPQSLAPGQEAQVTLGITNQENQIEVYRVEVLLDGEKINEISPFELDNQRQWQQVITFRATKSGGRQMLLFQLYRGGSDQPYRSLHLWINESGPS